MSRSFVCPASNYGQNRPSLHARAHKLLNTEVRHTLLRLQAEQHLHCSTLPLLDAVVSLGLSPTHLFMTEIKKVHVSVVSGALVQGRDFFCLLFF